MDQIAPRLRTIIPTAVKPVGCEDAEELVQDGLAFAAQLLHSLEAKGRQVTAGNICYYVVLHLKSGRRSQPGSRTDALAPGAMLDGKSMALSLEEPLGFCSETGESVPLGDLLADTHEDPASAGHRLDRVPRAT